MCIYIFLIEKEIFFYKKEKKILQTKKAVFFGIISEPLPSSIT